MTFDKEKIEELYPQAGELMWPPQLCWHLPKGKEDKLQEICNSGDYFASYKKDGACYQVVKTKNYSYLFGRTQSKVTGLLSEKSKNVPHIIQAFSTLPPNTVIVVEIYYPGKTSKDVTKIMGCLEKLAIERQKDKPIHAYAHDILFYDGVDLRNVGALERYKILAAIWRLYDFSSFDFLELAQPIYDNIYETGLKAIEEGEEGLVLRKKDGQWVCGGRPAYNTIKLKQSDTIDLICCGFEPATKTYDGKEIQTWCFWESSHGEKTNQNMYGIEGWKPITKPYYFNWPGAIQIGAYDDNGNLIKLGTVSSGLTDEDKQNIIKNPDRYLGSVVALSCMSIDSKEKTLRHPVFKSWREDKNAKECLINEVFK